MMERQGYRCKKGAFFLVMTILSSPIFFSLQGLAKPAKRIPSPGSSKPLLSPSLPRALSWVVIPGDESNIFHFSYVVSQKGPVVLTVETVAQDEEGNLLKAITQPIHKVAVGVKAPGRYFWTWRVEKALTCSVIHSNGLRSADSARFLCFTVQSGSSSKHYQRLYFPLQMSRARIALIPQEGESVTRLNDEVVMGVALQNPQAKLMDCELRYDLRTETGLEVDSGVTPAVVPGNSVLVALMKLGKASLPGPLKLRVSLRQMGREVASDQQVLATAPPLVEIFAPDAPVGIANGDLSLSERLGAKWWLGPWPFWESSGRGDWMSSQTGSFTSREFFSAAERKGLFISSLLTLDGQWEAQVEALKRAMQDFIRRPSAWIYALPSLSSEEATLRERIEAFYHLAKTIHRDSVAGVLCDSHLYLPLVSGGGLESTDVIILRADTPQTMADLSQRFSSLKEERIPGRSLWWLVKEEEEGPQSAQTLVKATVLALASGFERVFLHTSNSHLPLAPMALGTLSYYLTGAEMVGRLSSPSEVFAYLFLKRGEPLVVAWAESSGPVPFSLPLSRTPEVRDVYFARATFARIQENRVWLTKQPVFITGLSPAVIPLAKGVFEQEYQAFSQGMTQLGLSVPVGWQWGATPNEWYLQEIRALLQWMMDHKGENRTLAIACFSRLLRLWDGEGLRLLINRSGNEVSAKQALDRANKAIADLRAEIHHRESSSGYLKEARLLLRMVEKRLSLGRVALRQGDFTLAQSRGEQVALSARHLIPLIGKEEGLHSGEVARGTRNGRISNLP